MQPSAKLPREEPDAGNLHVRVCGGRGWKHPRLPGAKAPDGCLGRHAGVARRARANTAPGESLPRGHGAPLIAWRGRELGPRLCPPYGVQYFETCVATMPSYGTSPLRIPTSRENWFMPATKSREIVAS